MDAPAVTCASCGAVQAASDRFCTRCGAVLGSQRPVAEAPATPGMMPQTPVTVSDIPSMSPAPVAAPTRTRRRALWITLAVLIILVLCAASILVPNLLVIAERGGWLF